MVAHNCIRDLKSNKSFLSDTFLTDNIFSIFMGILLHTPCWEDVYKTARARGRSKLGVCEKKMILEGAKSVERFYSLEEVKK